jgi:hypothetical protein
VRLHTIVDLHRSLVHPIVAYVEQLQAQAVDREIAVLIPEVEPRRWRYQILQNQRGLLLATVLRAHTDVVVCMLPYRLASR